MCFPQNSLSISFSLSNTRPSLLRLKKNVVPPPPPILILLFFVVCCLRSIISSYSRSCYPTTSSPGRFSCGFGGGAPHLQSQGKAPWGRGWIPDDRGKNLENRKRFYFPDASQMSAIVADHSRRMKTQIFTVGGRRWWISLITNPLNCWAPVPLSHICVQFNFWHTFHFSPNSISGESGVEFWPRLLKS